MLILIITILVIANIRLYTTICPKLCDCDINNKPHVTKCLMGGLKEIPINEIDNRTQILIINGSAKKQNNFTIGRIFNNFRQLSTLILKYNNIPAIGDSSFWPGKSLKTLDLSYNNINSLTRNDFKYCYNISELNLSHNQIQSMPSAVFRFMFKLTTLILSYNNLMNLVPRMFYNLTKLHLLDLSYNPLMKINVDEIKDAYNLRKLYLSNCKLKTFHSLIYSNLKFLEELDLSNNLIHNLYPYEYHYLISLNILLLKGNILSKLDNYLFNGLQLQLLDLSYNTIKTISICTFCNCSIFNLDISNNQINTTSEYIFKPLENTLLYLNLANNTFLEDPSHHLHLLLSPLNELHTLNISSLRIDDTLRIDTFQSIGNTLKSLDMSYNFLNNFNPLIFLPLKNIKYIDLSYNYIKGFNYSHINIFKSLDSLNNIVLIGNYWSCTTCHITPLKEWLSSKPVAYMNSCKNGHGLCARCLTPDNLYNKDISQLSQFELDWCYNNTVKLRLAASEPNIGLILALIIIITLIIIIIIVIFMYRRKSAVYYTHEDDTLDDKTVFTIEQAAKITQQYAISPQPLSSSNNSSSPPISPPPTTISNQSTPTTPKKQHYSHSHFFHHPIVSSASYYETRPKQHF